MNRLISLLLVLLAFTAPAAEPLDFTVKLETVLKHDDGKFLWFHPRAAAVPSTDSSAPTAVMTIQKHLKVSDYYSGLHVLTRATPTAPWVGPVLPAELDWKQQPDGVTISVADVTPGWHAPTARLLAIGCQVRYSPKGAQLDDVKRAHQTVYAVFDPKTSKWTPWQVLELPADEEFNFARNACAQWLVRPDGVLLVPLYVGKSAKDRYSTTVAECRFDGTKLTYQRHGSVLRLPVARGLYEPSLAAFQGRYFLTLRNDLRGYVSVSDDGLNFAEPKPWLFDDGTELGSYNTQQHWLTHSDGLFLVYTRRGANNDHIIRHRAPLFMAQVDITALRILRATEKVVVPERGAELGNFGCNAFNEAESWVTVSEGMFMKDSKQRGAEGATFVARILWSKPNQLARAATPAATRLRIVTLGDSITKGVRSGVKAEETFAARLEAGLRAGGADVSVVNVGIGGERTDQALRRLAKDVLAQKPSVVTIMYGTNDSYVDQGKSASRITVEEYRANLARLVDELRAAGVTPVLMTEPRWGKTARLNGAGEHPNVRLEKYVEACRAVAAEKRTPLVDHFQHWTAAEAKGTDIGGWTTDQCHPNPEGHRVLAELMLPVVRAALKPAP
jgi:lysophospholipase L1-like esterase